MTAATYDFRIDAGADFTRTFTWLHAGTAVDLTGYIARMQLRRSYKDPTAAFEFSSDGSPAEITLDNEGVITLTIENAITNEMSGKYIYDLELTDTDGLITRLIEGTITTAPQVTI